MHFCFLFIFFNYLAFDFSSTFSFPRTHKLNLSQSNRKRLCSNNWTPGTGDLSSTYSATPTVELFRFSITASNNDWFLLYRMEIRDYCCCKT
ncbi:hypothetical protein BDB00DRAFT_835735 [Zychaea mexicana]|uniref:uncharacterized protein n=1 Tax=Zychaea mexicana TaxID=64656 RepID=UPI0022FDFEF1|nr:uncharacterized protein BDB00DRAFT_835735 [Zychaea mexicana]KAI9490865.1 hypothetical protein BDB00DRAFT_835735 [Zychaea mexicana]